MCLRRNRETYRIADSYFAAFENFPVHASAEIGYQGRSQPRVHAVHQRAGFGFPVNAKNRAADPKCATDRRSEIEVLNQQIRASSVPRDSGGQR